VKIHKASKQEFDTVVYKTHMAVFEDKVEETFFRYDYALFTEDGNGEPISYTLCRELNEDTVEMAYGGTVKEHRGLSSKESMMMILNELLSTYKRAVFQTKNTNFPMLRLALSLGGKIIGVHQNPRNDMYVSVEFDGGSK
jgi:ribosomal protein S8E